MTTSSRYYITNGLTLGIHGDVIVDSHGGHIVATDAKLDARERHIVYRSDLRQWRNHLNAKDYATRRQYGEPRKAFTARMGVPS